MSEATLQRFMERLNGDAAYRESVQADPEGAIAALGLSPAEQAALTSGDEDALRRLTGADVAGYMSFISELLGRGICVTFLNTPGSGRHCGTGDQFRGC
ncbi:MAG: hypothetical protein AB7R89_32845 [Dehalococcoidia bacterium]